MIKAYRERTQKKVAERDRARIERERQIRIKRTAEMATARRMRKRIRLLRADRERRREAAR